jgi:gamma-glutamylcyclotransferase (GGCT)/AIG2-like uncharacterized protein YtfP
MNIFTYGSLMFDSVWSRVTAGCSERILAGLSGYRRRLLSGRIYPALVPGTPEDMVMGVAYLDVQPEAVSKLDLFEGELYRREQVRCVVRQGETLPAETFVLRTEYLHLAIDRDWDPDLFARTGLAAFLNDDEEFGR